MVSAWDTMAEIGREGDITLVADTVNSSVSFLLTCGEIDAYTQYCINSTSCYPFNNFSTHLTFSLVETLLGVDAPEVH